MLFYVCLFVFLYFSSLHFGPFYEMKQQEMISNLFLITMLKKKKKKQLPSNPDILPATFLMIQSVALVDRTSRPESISLLRVEELPEDPLERFNQLFTIREKWTEDDITPYIQ